MTQAAQTTPSYKEENFGVLEQLEGLTRAFMDACNQDVQTAALEFDKVKNHILENTNVGEDKAIAIIFKEIAKISSNSKALPTYNVGALEHVFSTGYEETDSVLEAVAHIGEATRTGQAAHLKAVPSR